jgi:hypothetical protein
MSSTGAATIASPSGTTSRGRRAAAVRTMIGSASGASATPRMPSPTVHLDTSSTTSALERALDSAFMAAPFVVSLGRRDGGVRCDRALA